MLRLFSTSPTATAFLIEEFTPNNLTQPPEDLQAAIVKMVETYNDTPHEALKNVSPNDVYAGRKDEVLERRAKIRLETMARRYAYNMGTDAGTAN
jgi:hypothetical protein